jgi:polyhydroxyalkanoate synthesis regulator phasin
MSSIFEDTINLGFGLFAYSREKIEEMVEKMVQKGEVAKKDASSFVSELTTKGEMERKELKKIIGDEIRDAMEVLKPITREEIRQIIRDEMNKSKETKK